LRGDQFTARAKTLQTMTEGARAAGPETDSAIVRPAFARAAGVTRQEASQPCTDVSRHDSRGSTGARKFRLLLVITRLTVGGDTNVLLDIARRFRNHPRIEAEIATGPVPPNEVDLTHLAYESRIPTSIISTLSNRPDPRQMIRAGLELRGLMRRRRYDIVHTHSSAAGVIGRMAAATARVPVIVHHVHGWGLQDGMSVPMRYAYLGLERLCTRFSDRLIAVSKATVQKGLVHRIGPEDKYTLIYNGINLQTFSQEVDALKVRLELGLDRDCRLVSMIGRLDRQKNPLDFIHAAALVVRQYPRVQFLIIGDGTLRAECERLIKQLNLRQRCILLGFRNDVARILPILSVVASTSLWEGLPILFQEAMCAGIPIVANDVDGVSDVVRDGETGYLVSPHNPQEMADRIVRLLRDEELRKRLGAHARRDSAEFSSEQMLEKIELLYMQLVTAHA
jgi:glycosyltransferase involved in cell wall biosynthesis